MNFCKEHKTNKLIVLIEKKLTTTHKKLLLRKLIVENKNKVSYRKYNDINNLFQIDLSEFKDTKSISNFINEKLLKIHS